MEPVASGIHHSFFSHSLSVSAPDILDSQSGGIVQNLLEPGAMSDDALYISDVNDVACMNEPCNKRISYAGPERSAGRPGHTPTRRELACEKNIEDSCAGQDGSAGQPGIRPFGASSAACSSSLMACLGPYGTTARQPHHTGPNTREEKFEASSRTTPTRRTAHQSTSSKLFEKIFSRRRSRVAGDGGSASTQATIFLWRIRRGCPCMDVHR